MINKTNFNIKEVTGCLGGECYLVVSGNKTVLCDTGFSFAAPQAASNIAEATGGAGPDYIALTHAHYDHAGGAAYLKSVFGNAAVIANSLSADIFARPGALRVMRELNASAVEEAPCRDPDASRGHGDMLDRFKADILVPGPEDYTVAPDLVAIAAPGHTRDTTSYYFEDLGLLFATETTGVVACGAVVPTFITSYAQSLDAASRMEEIAAPSILSPHYGLLSGDDALLFPARAREACEVFADFVLSRHQSGMTYDEIVRAIHTAYYDALLLPTGKQPLAAFITNAKAVIPRLIAELE
ncbi:MAG: MBL fold metallo-hydrolase [Clostridiales Family XIII bacterium]|jgi:glyoxylase-like metal-dependent hydrolase (beta-lactamase superfamily II)|nr:MBL fold metallo-hydrolase [Clostridiales Family XIII bacterium]